MSKVCVMKGCGKPATWTFATWEYEDEPEGRILVRNQLCEDHAERYKDHEDVVSRERSNLSIEELSTRVDRLEEEIRKLKIRTVGLDKLGPI